MNKGKLVKATIFILLTAGLLQAGITAYSTIADTEFRENAQAVAYANTQNAAVAETTVQQTEIPKGAIDISGVALKKEVEDKIASLDAVKADRNIKNYKTVLVEFDVPESFQSLMEEMYIKEHKVQNVLITYEFLYQNYGTITELEGLIQQKESGKAWNVIFKEYMKGKEVFKPRNFESGKLEKVFNTPGITPDDVIIADRVSLQTGMEFDELISMRGHGAGWKTINEGLRIVNTSAELPRTAVTSAQVKKHMKETGLSEAKVIEALVLAQKLDKDGKSVVDKVKAGSAEADIIADCLEEKYQ